LSGGCMVPIAALGQREGERLHLRGLVSSPQGDQVLRREIRGPASSRGAGPAVGRADAGRWRPRYSAACSAIGVILRPAIKGDR
jgi:hydroxymethylbilane synthase